MKEFRHTFIPLFLIMFLAGCSLTSNNPTQDLVTPSIHPGFMQSTPNSGPLTVEILKNAEYQAQNGTVLVKLVDGSYEAGPGADYLSVSMLDQFAIGDLNSDGIEDAAIVLVENYGGSGMFEYLVPVFNNGGSASPSSGFLLGDRVAVNSIMIEDGRILLDMVVQGPNDPFCCPSQAMTQTFKFYWGPGLIQVGVSSGTPTGGLREIDIENPTASTEVSKQIHLTGKVSISPFENTLLVRIVDANNIPIYQGPIMVSAADIGAPGSFETLVDISSSSPSSGMIRIEVLDISMADGSTIAMDSVDVNLK